MHVAHASHPAPTTAGLPHPSPLLPVPCPPHVVRPDPSPLSLPDSDAGLVNHLCLVSPIVIVQESHRIMANAPASGPGSSGGWAGGRAS